MRCVKSNRLKWSLPILVFSAVSCILSFVWPFSEANSFNSSGKTMPQSSASTKGRVNGKIIFTSTRNLLKPPDLGLRLWTMNPDGSNPTELTNYQIPVPSQSSLPPNDTAAKWSPDGTRIAFLSTREFVDVDHDPSPYTIYIMDANGANLQRLSLNELFKLSPVNCTELYSFEWSPDGNRFLLDAGN